MHEKKCHNTEEEWENKGIERDSVLDVTLEQKNKSSIDLSTDLLPETTESLFKLL